MRWPLTIVVLSLVVTLSLGLYRLESEVQILERRLAKATSQLEDNRRNYSILAAEWSFLSQPSRIQELAHRHLSLQELTPEQISHLLALPSKTLVGTANAGNAIANKQESEPPLPRWKPAKQQRKESERIILADHGWLPR